MEADGEGDDWSPDLKVATDGDDIESPEASVTTDMVNSKGVDANLLQPVTVPSRPFSSSSAGRNISEIHLEADEAVSGVIQIAGNHLLSLAVDVKIDKKVGGTVSFSRPPAKPPNEIFEDYLLVSGEDRVGPGRDETVGRLVVPVTTIKDSVVEVPLLVAKALVELSNSQELRKVIFNLPRPLYDRHSDDVRFVISELFLDASPKVIVDNIFLYNALSGIRLDQIDIGIYDLRCFLISTRPIVGSGASFILTFSVEVLFERPSAKPPDNFTVDYFGLNLMRMAWTFNSLFEFLSRDGVRFLFGFQQTQIRGFQFGRSFVAAAIKVPLGALKIDSALEISTIFSYGVGNPSRCGMRCSALVAELFSHLTRMNLYSWNIMLGAYLGPQRLRRLQELAAPLIVLWNFIDTPVKNAVEQFRFSAKFIEMRTQGLVLFVNSITAHHELHQREDWKIFLQVDEDTVARASSQKTCIFKRKPSHLMQMFKAVQPKVSCVVLEIVKPVEESTPECEQLKHYVFDNYLVEAQTRAYHLVKSHRELGHTLSDFGKILKLLDTRDGTALGMAFTEVGGESEMISFKLRKEAHHVLMNFEEQISARENYMIKKILLGHWTFVGLAMGNPLKAFSAAKTLLEFPDCANICLFLGYVCAAGAIDWLGVLKEVAEQLSKYINEETGFILHYSEADHESWKIKRDRVSGEALELFNSMLLRNWKFKDERKLGIPANDFPVNYRYCKCNSGGHPSVEAAPNCELSVDSLKKPNYFVKFDGRRQEFLWQGSRVAVPMFSVSSEANLKAGYSETSSYAPENRMSPNASYTLPKQVVHGAAPNEGIHSCVSAKFSNIVVIRGPARSTGGAATTAMLVSHVVQEDFWDRTNLRKEFCMMVVLDNCNMVIGGVVMDYKFNVFSSPRPPEMHLKSVVCGSLVLYFKPHLEDKVNLMGEELIGIRVRVARPSQFGLESWCTEVHKRWASHFAVYNRLVGEFSVDPGTAKVLIFFRFSQCSWEFFNLEDKVILMGDGMIGFGLLPGYWAALLWHYK